jgi:hypothetical protein
MQYVLVLTTKVFKGVWNCAKANGIPFHHINSILCKPMWCVKVEVTISSLSRFIQLYLLYHEHKFRKLRGAETWRYCLATLTKRYTLIEFPNDQILSTSSFPSSLLLFFFPLTFFALPSRKFSESFENALKLDDSLLRFPFRLTTVFRHVMPVWF